MKSARVAVGSLTIVFACMGLGQSATISPGGTGNLGTVHYVSGNIALGGTASQTSTRVGTGANVAFAAIDGDTNGSFFSGGPSGTGSTTHTANDGPGEFWQVNLNGEFAIGNITIFGRSECCQDRLANFDVDLEHLGANVFNLTHTTQVPTMGGTQTNPPAGLNLTMANNTIGDLVRITQNDAFVLSLAEVQAFGVANMTLGGDSILIELSDLGNDFINVEGTATLNGTIDVSEIDGFEAANLATFDVLNAASIDAGGLIINGDFSFIIVDEADGTQTLRLVAHMVPEPSAAALWTLGMMAFALAAWGLRRRNRPTATS